MSREKPAPDLIRGRNRFSEKIRLRQETLAFGVEDRIA
jgi:hypothetical protein